MKARVHAPGEGPARLDRLDALRGLVMVWMAVFHFCFDLNHLGLLQTRQDFYADPFWTLQRGAIVFLFLWCSGVSLAVALQAGQGWPRFWRRWLQIAACAALVSAGSAMMFPRSWISFGVLHGVAVMLLLARLLALNQTVLTPAARQAGLWILGGACALLPVLVAHPFFDSRWTNGVGLVTRKPVTEDFVPVLPWFCAMLWGLASGRWILAHRRRWLAGPLPAQARALAALGRYSLSFYMLHQPVLIGLLMAWRIWR